jgi:hypothetical protein
VVIFSKWQTMAQDRISLVDHLDGLIFLADQARQLPPGRCVYLAHTFRQLGQACLVRHIRMPPWHSGRAGL